ncbi:hypothetical protein IAQ61_003157 [Plenodomus lingam]|uniref:uncharacterized protein n=1 Tax=Leptosphaeria maculans TaxID=5022 RepID=UPI00331F4C47|nr:hypothetical protein IAQ61_003157 [Plenodomus lingam]
MTGRDRQKKISIESEEYGGYPKNISPPKWLAENSNTNPTGRGHDKTKGPAESRHAKSHTYVCQPRGAARNAFANKCASNT